MRNNARVTSVCVGIIPIIPNIMLLYGGSAERHSYARRHAVRAMQWYMMVMCPPIQ